jgi:thioredoxin 2
MNSAANAQIISCPKCGAKNRVDPAQTADAICGRCKTPLTAEAHPVYVTDQNFADEVESSPLPMLVDFWAGWCGPCRLIAPTIEQLAKELSGKVRMGKLDVDANQRVSARFGVRSLPTMIVFKDGKEVDRLIGAQSKEAILRRLTPFL